MDSPDHWERPGAPAPTSSWDQPAAAVDPLTGIYHAFAIYELRSGDAACGSRFHVYITDLFNMRCLVRAR